MVGFFKPNSEHNRKEDVLEVEFDKDDGTKVLISPLNQAEIPSKGKPKLGHVTDLKDELYEKAEEASSILPNIGQEKVKDTVTETSNKFNFELLSLDSR
ncbi:hypothetical protein K7X08_025726 [Anisodus acutangulus]|uniref:Uncharacterized protein n=1 Tax=Anisodus acutangulus TaxID=402998 RepID=A0A9Q1QVX4_9SOLA|nr:hypothetical protein K7X08_025726 [Anisodus acutangulus]